MPLFSEIIFDIKNLRNNGRTAQSTTLSERQIAFHINHYRASLIRQSIQKGYKINQSITQNLGKVKIKRAEPGECSCDIRGCNIYKVQLTVPKAVEVDGDLLFTFIGTTGGRAFQRTSFERLPHDFNAKYTGKMDKWFMLGDDLYIASPSATLGSHINIHLVAEDPKKANEYKTCSCDNGVACYTGFDFDYPISITMLDTLKKMIMDGELRFMDMHKQDNTNNSEDDQAVN